MTFKKTIRKIIPDFVVSFYHFLWALFGALAYRFPGKDIEVIGVTGTNGKSTTVKLITEILKESGRSVAVISSIDFEVDGEKRKNMMKMTMFGSTVTEHQAGLQIQFAEPESCLKQSTLSSFLLINSKKAVHQPFGNCTISLNRGTTKRPNLTTKMSPTSLSKILKSSLMLPGRISTCALKSLERQSWVHF